MGCMCLIVLHSQSPHPAAAVRTGLSRNFDRAGGGGGGGVAACAGRVPSSEGDPRRLSQEAITGGHHRARAPPSLGAFVDPRPRVARHAVKGCPLPKRGSPPVGTTLARPPLAPRWLAPRWHHAGSPPVGTTLARPPLTPRWLAPRWHHAGGPHEVPCTCRVVRQHPHASCTCRVVRRQHPHAPCTCRVASSCAPRGMGPTRHI